jgi:hypothetical protein
MPKAFLPGIGGIDRCVSGMMAVWDIPLRTSSDAGFSDGAAGNKICPQIALICPLIFADVVAELCLLPQCFV